MFLTKFGVLVMLTILLTLGKIACQDFIERPQNVTVPLNSTVEMRCKPNGSDVFIWLLNDEQLQPGNLPSFITAGDNNLHVLNVFAAEELNGSVFTCVAFREDSRTSTTGQLLIQDPEAPFKNESCHVNCDEHSNGSFLSGTSTLLLLFTLLLAVSC